jgi:predicted NBD/HSP70 family sugar kinase
MHSEVIRAERPMNPTARSVFEQILLSGPISRAELSRRLSLSAASLTKITRPLLDSGHLVEGEVFSDGSAGRPSQPLNLNEDFAHFIGIKLTGERLFAVITTARGRIVHALTMQLVEHSVEHVVRLIAEAVIELRNHDRSVAGIGISLSGNATRDEPSVRKSPFLHWYGVPLATLVSEITGLPTVLDNDVRALTSAEHWFGAAQDLSSFVLLTFGAGIGCGMVTNGQQIDGRQGASGLIGHLPINDYGPLCYAGHRGCAHSYATTNGLAKTVSAGLGVSLLTFEECVELVQQGDPVAQTAFDEAGNAIGQLIATVVNILGPDKVLIAGEGIQMYEFGKDAADRKIGEMLHWTASRPEILVQPFDFTEWARGAAVVAIQQHIREIDVLHTATAEERRA